ncbi:hypothetical protein [Agrobacterium pusense]|uniref:hypothetical protein n=1 Tax=Agrobacterium pusense TaxID=648995 RepID=UPI00156AAB9B|nr:hypothetical protein [Agrobacterium pusense]QKJ90910.1 hypothetical protein HQN82_05870 [Agrobacterium pusense]
MKQTADLVSGELVRISFGASASIAVFMKHLDRGRSLIGVLKSESFANPMTWYVGDLQDHVLSYGVDWVVDEIHGPETACRGRYGQQSATIHLTKNGPVMSFRAPEHSGGFGFVHFNLSDNAEVDFDAGGAPVDNWSVWESLDHVNAGGDPILEMNKAGS